jgi:CheY-like chemotaxis protein
MIDSSLKCANILIVDDKEANIYVLEGLLEMQGYSNIKSTTDSREVISLFKSFAPDLILLDLMMPHVDGFEAMKQLKPYIGIGKYLPILVLTADVSAEAKQRALSNGASDFLTKPFDLIEVALRIKNLLYMSYLQQLLQNQNLVLEEKVKERTAELEATNIELNIAKNKAEASDKLKTAFINNISHEIRTPLNGILGFGQILTDTTLTSDEKEEYLSMLNTSSDRLINTVTNFIDISLLKSKTQEVNKRDFELESLINAIAQIFVKPCQSKNLDFSIDIPLAGQGLIVNTDKELLEKALFHLVDNAVKFTDNGFIKIGFEINETNVSFYIKDSGKGVAPEFHKEIFNSFSQEDSFMTRGYEGSGLGLSIASGIIGLLGGKIDLYSEKGKGSTFSFSLPCISQSSAIKLKNSFAINRKADEKFKILVAEDDEFNFFYINMLLKADLVDIYHAENGQEAVEFCRNNPDIDLVLMDLKMPVMDGFEATSLIKAFRNDLPVIAVTAFSGSEDRRKAMSAGCDEFLTKPLKKEILFDTLVKFGMVIS